MLVCVHWCLKTEMGKHLKDQLLLQTVFPWDIKHSKLYPADNVSPVFSSMTILSTRYNMFFSSGCTSLAMKEKLFLTARANGSSERCGCWCFTERMLNKTVCWFWIDVVTPWQITSQFVFLLNWTWCHVTLRFTGMYSLTVYWNTLFCLTPSAPAEIYNTDL